MGSFIRAGLVHRLDKETDGLMIIAKTEQGLAHFKSLFQQKSLAESIEAKESVPLKKFYQATVKVTPS
jgi:23S rRNA-/tRNA-specific pseudouridylate synthase